MKLCKDCKYWEPSTSSTAELSFDKCNREKLPTGEVSFVTGLPIPPRRVFAFDERKFGTCGAEAIFFQPREKESDNAPF